MLTSPHLHARSKKVITTAGSQDKLDFCKSLGADVGINYKEESDFSKTVLDATDGQGVNVAIDFGKPSLSLISDPLVQMAAC